MSQRIRILVVEDHVMVREGLCGLIGSCSDMEVVGEATDGVEAVVMALALRPDVTLMDLAMPRRDGLEAIKEIKQQFPEARILVLTSFGQDRKVFLAIKAGALGYVVKDSSSKDLVQAIRDVYQRQLSVPPALASGVVRELSRSSTAPPGEDALAAREIEVLKLVAQGLGNQEIAQRLVLSESTVNTYVSNILAKLHLVNRTQAALYALREGLAVLDFDS